MASNVVRWAGSNPGKKAQPKPAFLPTPFLTQQEWAAIRKNGHIAALHMQRIMASPDFVKLPAREQAYIINIAMKYAYAPQVTEYKPELPEGEQTVSGNALKSLAQTASATLPELRQSEERKAAERSANRDPGNDP